MANDYVPRPDGNFDTWQANFVSYVSANMAALGLVAGDITPLTTAQTAWTTAYGGHTTAAAAAEAARQTKDDRRGDYEGVIRPLVRRLQAGPTVTDTQRQAMGVTVRDTQPTPVGPPTSRPVGRVDSGQRLRHTVHFADEATPTSKAKPAGATGCEIWVKIGTAPVDPAELTFLALDTNSPYVTEFAGADGGKTAHYMLRWVNPRSEKGPWSETVSATIGA
jgi:hypothetical protein